MAEEDSGKKEFNKVLNDVEWKIAWLEANNAPDVKEFKSALNELRGERQRLAKAVDGKDEATIKELTDYARRFGDLVNKRTGEMEGKVGSKPPAAPPEKKEAPPYHKPPTPLKPEKGKKKKEGGIFGFFKKPEKKEEEFKEFPEPVMKLKAPPAKKPVSPPQPVNPPATKEPMPPAPPLPVKLPVKKEPKAPPAVKPKPPEPVEKEEEEEKVAEEAKKIVSETLIAGTSMEEKPPPGILKPKLKPKPVEMFDKKTMEKHEELQLQAKVTPKAFARDVLGLKDSMDETTKKMANEYRRKVEELKEQMSSLREEARSETLETKLAEYERQLEEIDAHVREEYIKTNYGFIKAVTDLLEKADREIEELAKKEEEDTENFQKLQGSIRGIDQTMQRKAFKTDVEELKENLDGLSSKLRSTTERLAALEKDERELKRTQEKVINFNQRLREMVKLAAEGVISRAELKEKTEELDKETVRILPPEEMDKPPEKE